MTYPPQGPRPPQGFGPRPQPYTNPYATPPQAPQGPGWARQGQAPQRSAGPQQYQQPQWRPQAPPWQAQQWQPQRQWQGQQQWGGPQFQPPQWQPPRRKKSGSAWWIALPVVVVLLMIGYFALSQGDDDVAGGTQVTYVNEEYTVPAVGEGPTQVVDTLDNPAMLTANPLYNQPVPIPVRCEPADVDDVRDADGLQRRMNDLNECLTRTFGPALEEAGFEAYQPRVLVYDSTGSTPCGELDMPNAFYCGANQGIYLSADLHRIAGSHQARLDYVMAHEYAHNVQGRTGILIQRVYEQGNAVTEGAELEVNRRLETQADCFAATFIASVSDSVGYTDADRGQILQAARSVGDDQFLPPAELPATHGTSASRELWTTRGLEASMFGECNTFIAPASEVR